MGAGRGREKDMRDEKGTEAKAFETVESCRRFECDVNILERDEG